MPISYDDISGNFVRAGPVRIHYGDVGDGMPVVCLHGTGPGSSAWGNFQSNVDALSGSHRVLLVDFPRFGKSDKVALPGPRLDVLSGVIRAFLDELKISSAHFIGNSMGAQVAMKVAIDTPERVKRLVLVAPAALSNSIFGATPTETVRQIAGYYADEGPTYEKMVRLVRSLFYDPSTVPEELIKQRYEASIEPDVIEVNKGGHWTHQPLDDELDKIAAPTLLVWGQDDRASPLDHALMTLRKLQDARLVVFQRCGHSVQLEYPQEFNRLALDFLSDGLPQQSRGAAGR